ncbi:MAG: hypothetical protein IPN03_00100 [Holophagales bacterium]|nr:hypothetical protein [Holophagales bacterium]
MGTVYRAWDGPNYLTVARTGYQIPDGYALLGYVYVKSDYLVHLPGYPALIRLFSFLGYQHAMLFVSMLCSAGAAILFYRLCRDTWHLPQPLFLATVFLFFPPRWLYFRAPARRRPRTSSSRSRRSPSSRRTGSGGPRSWRRSRRSRGFPASSSRRLSA